MPASNTAHPTGSLVAWNVTQDNQHAKITTALGVNKLFLEGFTARESLSEPFTILCNVLGPHEATPMGAQIGTGVSIKVDDDVGGIRASRCFHGVLAEATLLEEVAMGQRYSLVLRPWFWVLSLGSNCRIYQQQSARDIIIDVFTRAGISTSDYNFDGVKGATETVSTYVYKRAFNWNTFDLGYPSAIATVWFGVVCAAVIILNRVFKSRDRLEY